MDDGPARVGLEHRRRFERIAKPTATRRKREPRLPAVEGIVIAVADERTNAGRVELFQAIDEFALRAQTAVRRVVDIPGHQQRVHLLRDAKIDDVVV